MKSTQNKKINQVKETTMVVGIDALVVKVVVSKTLKLLLHSFRLSDDTPYLP